MTAHRDACVGMIRPACGETADRRGDGGGTRHAERDRRAARNGLGRYRTMKASQIAASSDTRDPGLAAPPSSGGWAQDLGRQLRMLRRFAGLSQAQLARLADTSQPAVSRLEKGRVAKQVLLVLHVGRVLNEALSRLDQAVLSAQARALLRGLDTLTAGRPAGGTVARDPGLEELVQIYCDLSPTHRRGLLITARGWRAASRQPLETSD